MKLIQAACQWGQKDFDGWVIGKARYCLHSRSEPASCESIPKKAAPGYVLLETTAYDAGRLPCRSLEICLVDINVLRNTGNVKGARCMPGQLTMTFLPEDLKSFRGYQPDSLWTKCSRSRPVDTQPAGGIVRLPQPCRDPFHTIPAPRPYRRLCPPDTK